jgi:hypothetical protein
VNVGDHGDPVHGYQPNVAGAPGVRPTSGRAGPV